MISPDSLARPGDTVLVDGALEAIVAIDHQASRVFTETKSINFEDLREPTAPDPSDTDAVELFLQADWAGRATPSYESVQKKCPCCPACYTMQTLQDGVPMTRHHFQDTACRCESKSCSCL